VRFTHGRRHVFVEWENQIQLETELIDASDKFWQDLLEGEFNSISRVNVLG